MKRIGLSIVMIVIALVAIAFFSGGNAYAQGYLSTSGVTGGTGFVHYPGATATLGGFGSPVMGPGYGRMGSTGMSPNYANFSQLGWLASGHHVDWHRHQGW